MEVRSLVHVSNHRIFKLTMILYLALWCFPNEKNTKLTKCYEKGQIAVFVSNLVKTHKKLNKNWTVTLWIEYIQEADRNDLFEL